MIRLLAIIGALVPFALGYTCYHYGSAYSTGHDLTINSPDYPRTFPYGINCYWEILIPNAESITVRCDYFNLRESWNCQEDYLEISEDETFENSQVYCGTGYLVHTVNTSVFKAHFRSEYRYQKSNNVPQTSLKKNRYYSSFGFECFLDYTEAPTVTESHPDNIETTSGKSNPSDTSESCECGMKHSSNAEGRIVGGDDATMHEYPWQCMLRDTYGNHYCGCSLINNKFILTASHCVVKDNGKVTNPEDIIVSLGDHQKYTQDETDKTIHIGVISVVPHENYDIETTDSDIAVLELVQPVEFSEAISPVCLPFTKKGYDMSGLEGTITGWGSTSSGGEDSEMLLEVDLPILTWEECQDYLGKYVTYNMTCTYEEGKDACQGDSGGPLISDMSNTGVFYQVGIVSWGVGCGVKDFPGVYTTVENYLDWIIRNTDGNFCKK